jgi:hypothetical protein
MQCPRELVPVVYMPLNEDEQTMMDDIIYYPKSIKRFTTKWDEDVISNLRSRLNDFKQDAKEALSKYQELLQKHKRLVDELTIEKKLASEPTTPVFTNRRCSDFMQNETLDTLYETPNQRFNRSFKSWQLTPKSISPFDHLEINNFDSPISRIRDRMDLPRSNILTRTSINDLFA